MTCSNQKFKTCYLLTIYTDEVIIFLIVFARDHDFLTKIKIVEVRKKIIRAPILKVWLGRRQGLTSSILDEARCWRRNSSQGRRKNTLEVS